MHMWRSPHQYRCYTQRAAACAYRTITSIAKGAAAGTTLGVSAFHGFADPDIWGVNASLHVE